MPIKITYWKVQFLKKGTNVFQYKKYDSFLEGKRTFQRWWLDSVCTIVHQRSFNMPECTRQDYIFINCWEIDKYGALVDKKFLKGLSAKEQSELNDLTRQLSDSEAQFYEPIIQKLQQIINKSKFTKDEIINL